MGKRQPALGRFSELALLLLWCVQSSPKDGQAIREELQQVHGLCLEPGTLWGALSRLEEQGWVEPLKPRVRDCAYHLTAVGKQVLEQASTLLQERIVISDLEEQQTPSRLSASPFLRKSRVILAKGLLRLYPRPWRRRYAAELVLVLEQQPIRFLTLLDLLRGVLDAWFHATEQLSLRRRRSAAISYICVFPLYLLCLFVLLVRPVANPFSGDGPGSEYLMYHFTYTISVVQVSSAMIPWSVFVEGVALLLGGLLLAGILLRSALGARRTWVQLLAALPVLVELLALVGLVTLLVLLFAPQYGDGDGSFLLGLILLGAVLLGAVTSLVLAYVEIFKKKLTRRIALVALLPATLGTLAMLGVWTAYLIWGITIWSSVSAFLPFLPFLSSPFQEWQRAWEMNLFLLALPTAYVLWRWFLALLTLQREAGTLSQ
ncbi:MAG TPA: PadR family transcriptional regulator [Ktedonobacteraceae bacterium]